MSHQDLQPGMDTKKSIPMNTVGLDGKDATFPREAEALTEMGCADLLPNNMDVNSAGELTRVQGEFDAFASALFFCFKLIPSKF